MAQAKQKISLNTGREIPFNKMVLSQQNVRKTEAGVSIEELADDLANRGLLTSLNVRAELDADGKETASIAFQQADAVTALWNYWPVRKSSRRR